MDRLSEIRRAKRLTRAELAERVGVEEATIARLETGSDGVSLNLTRNIAAALRVSVEELFDTSERLELTEILAQLHREDREALLRLARAMAEARSLDRRPEADSY